MNNNLIAVPYAYMKQRTTGANIKHIEKAQDIYCRNFCVALVSAKYQNPEDDVALITNLEELQPEYKELLDSYGILMIHQEFDTFLFEKESKWQLAFYKLCALRAAVEKYPHERYLIMDTDVFVQNSFQEVWKEADQHILMYDINHGLQVRDYRDFLDEIHSFTGTKQLLTQYGGEFFCACHTDAVLFVEQCMIIYHKMREKGLTTSFGDEFISSLAAGAMSNRIKNAGAYIYRFWTGSFRLVSGCYKYNPVVILHVPDEKEHGLLRLYKRYISKRKMPDIKKVYGILHITHPSFRTVLKICFFRIRGREE